MIVVTCGAHSVHDVAGEAEGHQLGRVQEPALLKRHPQINVHHLHAPHCRSQALDKNSDIGVAPAALCIPGEELSGCSNCSTTPDRHSSHNPLQTSVRATQCASEGIAWVFVVFIYCTLFLPEARCACREAACKGCHNPTPVWDTPCGYTEDVE